MIYTAEQWDIRSDNMIDEGLVPQIAAICIDCMKVIPNELYPDLSDKECHCGLISSLEEELKAHGLEELDGWYVSDEEVNELGEYV